MSAILGRPAIINHDTNPFFSNRLGHHDAHNGNYGEEPTFNRTLRNPPASFVTHPVPKDPQQFPVCVRCKRSVLDQYLYRIQDQIWHESCATCCICSTELGEVCFMVNKDELLCRRDYERLYAVKCANCRQPMRSHELFMRARSSTSLSSPSQSEFIFHVSCFTCSMCQQPIAAGEAYVLDPQTNKPICRSDYLQRARTTQRSSPSLVEKSKQVTNSGVTTPEHCNNTRTTADLDGRLSNHDPHVSLESSSSQYFYSISSSNRRIRTSLTDEQRFRLQKAYELNSRPAKHIRENLAAELNVPIRVVQVWFQNQRARDKRTTVRVSGDRSSGSNPVNTTDVLVKPYQDTLQPQAQQSGQYYTPSPHTSIESGPFPEFGGFSVDATHPSHNQITTDDHNINSSSSTLQQQPWHSVSNAVWLVENDTEHPVIR